MILSRVFTVNSCFVTSVLFSRLLSDFMVLGSNVLNVCSKDFLPLIRAVANVAVGVRCVLLYPAPYLFGEYISRYVPLFDACQFAMMADGQTLTVRRGNEERETA